MNALRFFNPFSNYDAIQRFWKLKFPNKAATLFGTLFAGVFTLGIGVTPFFRYWTGAKLLKTKHLSPSARKAHSFWCQSCFPKRFQSTTPKVNVPSPRKATTKHVLKQKEHPKIPSMTPQELSTNQRKFFEAMHTFGGPALAVDFLDTKEVAFQKKVALHANETFPLVYEGTKILFEGFLKHKQQHGSPAEKQLYHEMDLEDFINRLLAKRALTFDIKSEEYQLVNGVKGKSWFETTGAQATVDHLSTEEVQLSSLIALVGPAHFTSDSYKGEGIAIGLSKPHFDKEGWMDWQHMIITEAQNTSKNGYGEEGSGVKRDLLNLWARFYGTLYFPTYQEAREENNSPEVMEENNSDDSLEVTPRYAFLFQGEYFDTFIYKKHLKATLGPLFIAVDQIARNQNKKAFIQLNYEFNYGITSSIEPDLILEVCKELIRRGKYKNICDISFGELAASGEKQEAIEEQGKQQDIRIHFNKERVKEGQLLVNIYNKNPFTLLDNQLQCDNFEKENGNVVSPTISLLHNPSINRTLHAQKLQSFWL